jgi:diketogulonate reductase-like aldo/keto reductase
VCGGAGFVGVGFEEGVVVHPKAGREAHQKENFEAWKCPLTAEDDAKINAAGKKFRF